MLFVDRTPDIWFPDQVEEHGRQWAMDSDGVKFAVPAIDDIEYEQKENYQYDDDVKQFELHTLRMTTKRLGSAKEVDVSRTASLRKEDLRCISVTVSPGSSSDDGDADLYDTFEWDNKASIKFMRARLDCDVTFAEEFELRSVCSVLTFSKIN